MTTTLKLIAGESVRIPVSGAAAVSLFTSVHLGDPAGAVVSVERAASAWSPPAAFSPEETLELPGVTDLELFPTGFLVLIVTTPATDTSAQVLIETRARRSQEASP